MTTKIKTRRLLQLDKVQEVVQLYIKEIRSQSEDIIDDDKLKKYINVYWCVDDKEFENCLSYRHQRDHQDKYLMFQPNNTIIENIINIDYKVRHNITTLNITHPFEFYIKELEYFFPNTFKKNAQALTYFKYDLDKVLISLRKSYNWYIDNYQYVEKHDYKMIYDKQVTNYNFKNLDEFYKLPDFKKNKIYDIIFIYLVQNIPYKKPYNIYTYTNLHNIYNLCVLEHILPNLKDGGNIILKLYYIITDSSINLIYYLRSLFDKINIYYSNIGQNTKLVFIVGENFDKKKHDKNKIKINHKKIIDNINNYTNNIIAIYNIEDRNKYDRNKEALIKYSEYVLRKKLKNYDLIYRLNNLLNIIPKNIILAKTTEYKYLNNAIIWCNKYNISVKPTYLLLNKNNLTKIIKNAIEPNFKVYNIYRPIPSSKILINNKMLSLIISDYLTFTQLLNQNIKLNVPEIITNKIRITTIKEANIWEILMHHIDKLYSINYLPDNKFNFEQFENMMRLSNIKKKNEEIYYTEDLHNIGKTKNLLIKIKIEKLIEIHDIIEKIASYNIIKIFSSSWLENDLSIYMVLIGVYEITFVYPNPIDSIKNQIFNAIYKIIIDKSNKIYNNYVLKTFDIDNDKIKLFYNKYWIKWLKQNY